MPQFELANFIPQIAWLALVFAILYFVVVTPTLPKLGHVIQAREDKVSGDVAAAAQAKAHADGVAADYTAQMAAAHDRARVTIAQAKDTASAATAARLAQVDAELLDQANAANTSLAAARTKVLTEIEAVIADTAADLVEKLTGARPSAQAARDAAGAAFQRN